MRRANNAGSVIARSFGFWIQHSRQNLLERVVLISTSDQSHFSSIYFSDVIHRIQVTVYIVHIDLGEMLDRALLVVD